jgi:pyruvate-ferredoxin/flavodoxin oxidoreductase
MNNGGTASTAVQRAWARDAVGAVMLAEGAIAQTVLLGLEADVTLPRTNAFGDVTTLERGGDIVGLLKRCEQLAASGARVALLAPAHALAEARSSLRRIAARRIGTVVHAVLDGRGDVSALADLGWGMLFASGAGESLDLSLIARRAAEDSGNPFLVIHERSHVRHTEPMSAPARELCEAFIGPAVGRTRVVDGLNGRHEPTPSDRVFSERVPFALGSAMRELEALTGRRHDVLDRSPSSDAALMLVGLGEVGESLIAEVDRLRAAGHDVCAVRITSLRPFPGARLIKALARALAVTVVERVDNPFAQSNPLALEVKSAFADALTWAPEYPGIGSIPRIVSGVVGEGGHELEPHDIDAMVSNMLADERGKRLFVLGGEPAYALDGPPLASAGASVWPTTGPFSMRGCVHDAETAVACADVCVAVVASALGLRTRASVRALRSTDGGGYAFDLVASRERPRGLHAPHAVRLVAMEDVRVFAEGNPLTCLANAGIVAVPTSHGSADALWAEIPAYVKAIVFDRTARLIGWSPGKAARPWLTAAGFAGLALAAAVSTAGVTRPAAGSVGREVVDALRTALSHAGLEPEDRLLSEADEVARRAFEAHVEVPRATVERDEDAIRLGRRDARANTR